MSLPLLSPVAFILALVIVLAAAFVQSLTGFGFALVGVPFLVLILNPKAIAPITLILGAGVNALALVAGRRQGNKCKLNRWLLAGALIGIPLGTYLLARLNPVLLRLLVGGAGITVGIGLARGYTWRIPRPQLAAMAVGIFSGALNSSTSMGGGPVALFLANQRLDKNNFRTHLLLYILLVNLAAILALLAADLLDALTFRLSLWLTPAMLAGFVLGRWQFSRVSRQRFTRIVIGVVVFTSTIGVLITFVDYLNQAVFH
ncbi:MAG: sulfite exporter TauE/SafE family protein [Spirochaetota bacterium]